MLLMLIFYVMPMVFSAWIWPEELDRMVFTTVDPQELWPFSLFFTYNYNYNDIQHTFFGFKLCYMMCLWFSSQFVTLIIDVYT